MGGRKMSQARKTSLVANGVKGLGKPELVASVKEGKLVVEAGNESWRWRQARKAGGGGR
jgi:hypothetical protein